MVSENRQIGAEVDCESPAKKMIRLLVRTSDLGQRTSGPQSGPATRTETVASPPGTSERGPLLLVPCLVGIFDRLNRLDVFCDILRRQAVFPATGKDKVLVPAVRFEAVVDVGGGGEIAKDLLPATFSR